MRKELHRRLAVIWQNKPPYRYVPRASPGRGPDGVAWDVFDRKTQKFITNKKAILRLTFEDCCEKIVN